MPHGIVINISLLLSIISIITALGAGIFILSRNYRHPSNVGFFLGIIFLALLETGNIISILSHRDALVVLGQRIALTGTFILPSLWFIFSLSFSRSNYKDIISRWSTVLLVLFAGTAISLYFTWIDNMIVLKKEGFPMLLLSWRQKYCHIFLLMGMMLNLIHLENTLISASPTKKRYIKYAIIGTGSIFAYYIYLSSEVILFSTTDLIYTPITASVILMGSLLSLFAFVKGRLMDVNIFISRYIIFNSLTILLTGIYLFTTGLGIHLIRLYGGTFNRLWISLFTFFSLLSLAILFLSSRIKRKLQVFVSKHFYRHKYEFRDKWMETVKRIESNIDIKDIQDNMVDMISETMGAKEVYLWLKDGEEYYKLVASTVPLLGSFHIREDHPLIKCICTYSRPFFLKEIKDGCNDVEIESIVQATRTVLCTPLMAGGELTGFILQGRDISGEDYGKDDLDLLHAIGIHAANVVRNYYLARKLMDMREKETFHHVSSFFIHDLKNFSSTLSILSRNAEDHIDNPVFQQDLLKTLKGMVKRMNAMVSNLTILTRGLQIRPSMADINSIIDDAIMSLNGYKSVKIIKRLNPVPKVSIDVEQIHKVCLNLLLNAIEASSENHEIEIQTSTRDKEIMLLVIDHGCGMSRDFMKDFLFKPFHSTKPKGLGIGLFQCKKIIEAHGGRIEVESQEGQGSEFRVFLPLR